MGASLGESPTKTMAARSASMSTDIASAILKPGDEVSVRPASRNTEYFKTRALLLSQKGVPAWLRLDPATMTGRVLALPTRLAYLPFAGCLV